ncbi:hypothetical protein ACFSQJ_06575 [Croceitalea marina]|uniref:DUF4382 domain-containing protein n=1 Tax=Croceitalea marina TaxID=1775166 RepID=A0ABW5MTJ8_9FLAO
MKKVGLYLIAFLVSISCNLSDDGVPCALPDGSSVDIIVQSMYIELVDANGTNLIANDTYPGLDISAEKDGFIIRPVVFDESQIPNLPKSVKDIIVLELLGPEGENTWVLKLNENENDTLAIDLKHGNADECGLFLLEVLSATYNGVQQNVEPFAVFDTDSKIDFKITVVK